jgi:hypothetical protein
MDIYIYTYIYLYMYMYLYMYLYLYMYYMYMYRHLGQALACHFSASRCFAAPPSCVLLAIAMDYLNVLIATMSSLSNRLVQKFVPLFFAGLAAGWLLTTYSSIRIIPREVFLRLHVPGLAAGWLWPWNWPHSPTSTTSLATWAFVWPFSPTWPMCHPHGSVYLRIVSP